MANPVSRSAARLRDRLTASSYYRRLTQARFDRACRDVLRTPPVRAAAGNAPVHVVSMVRTEHLRMYLLAIKSFMRRLAQDGIGPVAVTVLDDGSLTEADRAVLGQHVEGIGTTRLDGLPTGPCPRGGCWERLLHILDLSAQQYVVQLDSDILTMGRIPKVTEAIAANACFTLNSGGGMFIVSLEAAAAAVAAGDQAALQTRAELVLPSLPAAGEDGILGRRYVRGSAGFAGFARGALTRADAEAFSRAMEARLDRATWSRWGTEQVTSSYLVANAPDGRVLPWPDYACLDPSVPEPERCALLHFVGSSRFAGGVYVACGRRTIAELTAHGAG
jgi:hypothetical protein